MNYIVLDTNIVLLDHLNVTTLGSDGSTIVLPSTVVQETDAKKSVPGELGYQARSFGRMVARGTIHDPFTTNNLVITPITLDCGTLVHITSTNFYPDFTDLDPSILNDRKIIEVALQYQNSYSDITFISNDVMARISATSLGLHSIDLKVTENTSYEFVKSFQVSDPEAFRTLHNSPIVTIDPDYKPEYYSYKFTCSTTNQVKLATVSNNIVSILGKDTERDIHKQDCQPINSEQLLASKAILDPTTDLVIIEGLAGSGKNIVALSNAIRLVRTSRDKYDGIVYVRTPINDESPGEDIGYLSGNEEKLAMYLGPMEDTVDFVVRNKFKKKTNESIEDYEARISESSTKLRSECGIESAISTGWRGRTLHNKIVILDEWANASLATSQKMLTRIGKNCKVIVIGSLNQIDSPYLSKFNNGMSILLDEAANQKVETNISMFAINLHKVVRSDMALFAEKLHK